MKKIALISLLVMCASGIGLAFAALPPGFEVQTVVTGLEQSTAMTFAPDGRIFVAEKKGVVKVIRNGVLLPTPLISLSDVNNYGDRGLIGIAVDPQFSVNGYLYLMYTYENSPGANIAGPKNGRLVRVTVVGDQADERTKVVLLGKTVGTLLNPSCESYARTADCIPSDTSSHSVGGLRFGPDGKLYAAIGDGAHFDFVDPRAQRAQDLDSLSGKILRLNKDGSAPTDNPYYNGSSTANRSKVFAYGLRNSFRFNFDTLGVLYAGDVGWSKWEELDKIMSGGNYGWPCREGSTATEYGCNPLPRVDPIYSYAHDINGAGSVTGGAFGTAYPSQFARTMFFGDYAQNFIRMANISSTGTLISVSDFMTPDDGPDGPVEFLRGLDGNVYFLSIYTGAVKKIVYTVGNRQPTAVLNVSSDSGAVPLTVTFDGTSSSDPDGNTLSYFYTFGDGTSSSSTKPTHTYTNAGRYNASLVVTDGAGGTSIVSTAIVAGNTHPVANITSPVNGALYRPNDTLTASAIATDKEDGVLPDSAYKWTILLHHNIHTHTLQQATGKSVTFQAPDHGADTDVYTEVVVEVTDASGQTTTKSVNIFLNNNPATTGNLVLNPSFEESMVAASTSPKNWQKGGYGINAAVYTYPVIGFEGEKGARVTVLSYTDGNAKWAFDPVSVDPNTSYTFSSYYKSTIAGSVTLQVANSSSTLSYIDLGDVPATNTWTKITRTFTTPANARSVSIFQEIAAVGSIDIDNISLTRNSSSTTVPTPPVVTPPTPPVVNPTSTPPTVIGSLFLNGNLEIASTSNNVFPSNFTRSGWGDNTAVFTYPVSEAASGKFARLQISRYVSGDQKWYPVPVSVIAGEVYQFSHSYRSNVPTSIDARYTHIDGTVSYKNIKAVVAPSATFVSDSYSIPVPAGTKFLTVIHILDRVGTLDVDNYSLSGKVPAPPQGSNLIINGNFETQGTSSGPQASTKGGWGNNVTNFTYASTGRSGARSVSLLVSEYTDGDVKWYPDAVTVSFGKQYTFSDWYRSTTVSDVIGRYTMTDGSVHYFGVAKEIQPATDWTFVSATFTPPIQAKSITFFHLISSLGQLDIDDMSLIQSGNATSTNDITPPSITLTSPIENQSVSGNVLLSALSSDAFGVTDVWFAVDGIPVGPHFATGPYQYMWDSTTYNNGVHVVKATTNDAAGNNTVATTSITVNNQLGSTTTPTTNLVPNGELEAAVGGVPASFIFSNWGDNVAQSEFPVAGAQGSGASVTISKYTNGIANWKPGFIPVTAGKTYTFTHKYKSSVQTSIDLQYIIQNEPRQYSYKNIAEVLPRTTDWVADSYTFTVPSGVSALTILHNLSATGTLSVDSFVLVESASQIPVTPPVVGTSTNLVRNASFEQKDSSGNPTDWLTGSYGTNNAQFRVSATSSQGASSAQIDITAYTDGDAKWFFSDVSIDPTSTYTYGSSYRSNVDTTLTVRYTMNDGSFVYVDIPNTAVASTDWAQYVGKLTPPPEARSVTVFHKLASNGYLIIDNVSLTKGSPKVPDTALFAEGMVSITLDDGWLSHVTTALPLLNEYGVKGTFGIISEETKLAVPDNRIANESMEIIDASTTLPTDWLFGTFGANNAVGSKTSPGEDGATAVTVSISSYTDGDAKWYFKDATVIPGQDYEYMSHYKSNATTTLTVRYTKNNGTVVLVDLGEVSPSVNYEHIHEVLSIPLDTVSLTIFHRLTSVGTLTIDNVSLKRVQVFVDTNQMLQLQSSGHELASHTKHHENLVAVATSTRVDEIAGSRTDLLAMGATPVTSFIYPYGDYNDTVKSESVQAGYIAGRGVDRGYNSRVDDKLSLMIQQVDDTATPQVIAGWIDTAIRERKWLILMYHQIDNSGKVLAETPEDFRATLEYMKSKSVKVVTMNEGVSLMD